MPEHPKVAWIRQQLDDGDVVTEDDTNDLLQQYDRMRDLLDLARSGLRVALGYADGTIVETDEVRRREELAGCREALRKATEALS